MLKKRIIPCLDIKDGQVVKGQKFKNIEAIADPIKLAKRYNIEGADELVFYDITASLENRNAFVNLVKSISLNLTIPFTIGGGIKTIDDFKTYLRAGADKISINSGALKNPNLIKDAATIYGNQCVVLSVDVKKTNNNYYIFTNGGQTNTNINALDWIKKGVLLGAGEIVINTIDTDGTRNGYDTFFLSEVCRAVNVPIIASGGAGKISDFVDVFNNTKVDAALAASVFHYDEINIRKLKETLINNSIPIRK